jgi:acetolactate synthase-1/2/3 large subunit
MKRSADACIQLEELPTPRRPICEIVRSVCARARERGCRIHLRDPGEENFDLLDSLSRSDSITLILTRHEQAAGFMASTYGRLTGKAGVCLSTLGPGAMNFVTAAAYAQLGGMPMLMITGQKPVKSSK